MTAASFAVGINWNHWNRWTNSKLIVSPRFSNLKSELMEYENISNISKVQHFDQIINMNQYLLQKDEIPDIWTTNCVSCIW